MLQWYTESLPCCKFLFHPVVFDFKEIFFKKKHTNSSVENKTKKNGGRNFLETDARKVFQFILSYIINWAQML